MNRPGISSSLATAATLLCLLLSACAIEKNYSTLSFFFDGVPDPDAPAPTPKPPPDTLDVASLTAAQRADMLGRKVPAAKVIVTFHSPVKERKCQSCHQGGGVTENRAFNMVPTLLEQPPGLCWRCHEEPHHESVHGPAAAGLCLICHQPHQSLHEHLLPVPEEELCRTCHVAETFATEAAHTEADVGRCTGCHDPHGSDRPNLLLPAAELELPQAPAAGHAPAPHPPAPDPSPADTSGSAGGGR